MKRKAVAWYSYYNVFQSYYIQGGERAKLEPGHLCHIT